MVCGEWFDWQTIRKPRIIQSWLVRLHAPEITLESHPVPPATLCQTELHCLVHSWSLWVHVRLCIHICVHFILFMHKWPEPSFALHIPSVTQAPYPSWCSWCLKWFQRKLCSTVESKLCMSRAGGWTFFRQWNFLESAWSWGVFWRELTSLLPITLGVCMAKGTAGQCRRVSCKCYLPDNTIL